MWLPSSVSLQSGSSQKSLRYCEAVLFHQQYERYPQGMDVQVRWGFYPNFFPSLNPLRIRVIIKYPSQIFLPIATISNAGTVDRTVSCRAFMNILCRILYLSYPVDHLSYPERSVQDLLFELLGQPDRSGSVRLTENNRDSPALKVDCS